MPSDIQVLQKYAKRMTAVCYDDVQFSVDVEKALVQNITSRPLFPNLRKVSGLFGSLMNPKLLADLFFGAKLDCVVLGLDSKNGPSLMHYIKSRCPSVKSMELFYENKPGVVQAIQNLILGLGKLESLTLSKLTLLDLIRVSVLPTLRHLDVREIEAGNTDSIPSSGQTHLISLALRVTDDLIIIDRLLSLCRPHQLQKFTLTSIISCPSSQWIQCFQTLSAYCSTTLETLIISSFGAEFVANDVLVPLVTLQKMTHLSMDCNFKNLGNHELKQIALAWPHLQELSLLQEVMLEDTFEELDTEVTLVGILPLLEHCSKLTELRVPMNVSHNCIRLPDRPWGDICNRNITSIAVGNTVNENPVAAAILFSHILPNLKHIRSWAEDEDYLLDDGNRSRWDEVCSLMEDLRVIGMQDVVWGLPGKDMGTGLKAAT
jgi:hypothetical protein